MNVKTFKKLIKEAVAEAVREELLAILTEDKSVSKAVPLKENKTITFDTGDVNEVLEARAMLRAKMGNTFGIPMPNNQSNVSNSGGNNNLTVDPTGDNPYLSFIMDAAANMTVQDKAGLKNLDS